MRASEKSLRSNLGRHTVDVVLPTLPKLGAVKSDVVVINFAAWQNQGDHMLRNITEFAEYYRCADSTWIESESYRNFCDMAVLSHCIN